jgi:cobalt-zinc-cadmium efflux system protein
MIAEVVGGYLTNSLALIADAGHMLTDVAGIALTLAAIWFGGRKPSEKKTYGYYRLEILAAFINGLVLVGLSFWIVIEAISRFRSPQQVLATEMTAIAAGGLVINIVAAYLLHQDHKHDLNIRGAFLHVLGDLLGSVVAIASGLTILLAGWPYADPLGSLIIGAIVIFGAARLVLESVNVLLEGTPTHIDIRKVEAAIRETNGVAGVHDLHVWTISSGIEALSAHINHHDEVSHTEVLGRVRTRLKEQFGIEHLTIQMETLDEKTEAVWVCETGRDCFLSTKPEQLEQAKKHARGN